MGKKIEKTRSKSRAPERFGRRRHVPDIKPGQYADGLPLNEVEYIECKLILRPNHFTSRKLSSISLRHYSDVFGNADELRRMMF